MKLDPARSRRVFTPRPWRRRLLTWIGTSSIAAFSSSAGAQVVWHSGFENGDLGEWTITLNRNTGARDNITVVADPVHSGSHAAKLVIHPDDLWPNGHNRVELHQNVASSGEGGTTFFSWFFKIPENAKQHDDIGYWESDGSYRQAMDFFVEPDADGMHLAFRTDLPNAQQHFSGPLSANAWHQLAMQVLWSTDPQVGKVTVWLDGALIVDKLSAQTKPDQNPVFIQVGYHRDAPQPDIETIYIDDAVEGMTLDDVLQPAPPAGGAGGVGGVGGVPAAATGGTGGTAGGGGGSSAGSDAGGVSGAYGAIGQAGASSLPSAGVGGGSLPLAGAPSSVGGAAGAITNAGDRAVARSTAGGCGIHPAGRPVSFFGFTALLILALARRGAAHRS